MNNFDYFYVFLIFEKTCFFGGKLINKEIIVVCPNQTCEVFITIRMVDL